MDILEISSAYLFDDADSSTIDLSDVERSIILAYRSHPDMQPAVRRLLGLTMQRRPAIRSLPSLPRMVLPSTVIPVILRSGRKSSGMPLPKCAIWSRTPTTGFSMAPAWRMLSLSPSRMTRII